MSETEQVERKDRREVQEGRQEPRIAKTVRSELRVKKQVVVAERDTEQQEVHQQVGQKTVTEDYA